MVRKTLLVSALFAALLGGSAWCFDAGGGISVFVPESLYLHNQGSISVETNFQYAIGFGKYFSIPIGITYDKIEGLEAYNPAVSSQPTSPWFVADSIMPYVEAKIHLPVWIFYLDLAGGVAANWNATLTPLGQNIESYLSSQQGSPVSFTNPVVAGGFGFGWVASAALGVQVKKVSVDLSATYRDISQTLGLSGTYYNVGSTSPIALDGSWSNQATLVMRGISIGLNGTFSF